MSLINIAPEMLKSTIGQKLPAVVSQTVSVPRTYRAAPSPSTHGSSPKSTAVDLTSCSFDQYFILDLPGDPGSLTVDLIVLHSTNVHSRQYHTLGDGRSTLLLNISLREAAITQFRYSAYVPD